MLQVATIGDARLAPFGSTSLSKSGWPSVSRGTRVRHRGKSKVMEAIDLFLEGMGLYRKQTARDATCLFRAVSEQVFYSQCFSYSVRLSCVHFMERNSSLFPEKVDGEPFVDHVRRMKSPREWGGQWEMQAMALLYKRDFIIFNDINTAPVQVTDNKFIDKILLCRIGSNHYDSVFAKSFIDSSAVCQGLMYELLYGQVFGMEDIDTAVQVMLYEGKQSKDFAEIKNLAKESNSRPNSVINVLVKGGTPFPYKVAKALDPRMYRNVEFDLWNDERKELKKKNVFHNEILQVGSKCMVNLNDSPNQRYPAYIQAMQPDKGPVTVFVEVLGKMCTVSYDNIEPMVLPMTKTRCIYINGTSAIHTQSTSTQSTVRFRRLKTSRLSEKGTTLREITHQISDKIQCTVPKIRQAMDFNNNQTVNQTMMIWSNSTTSTNISSSPESSSNSLDSHETQCSAETEVQSGLPMMETPYYFAMTPPSAHQWGMFPPIPACPPPPTVTYSVPQQQQQAIPMPMYVTFSDGTTIVVPAHQSSSPQQSPPPLVYHYHDTSTNVPPPPAPFCPPPPFPGMVSNVDQQMDNNNMSLVDQQQQQPQQFMMHQEDTRGVNLYEGPSVNVMAIQSGYWSTEQQQPPPQTHMSPPPQNKLNGFIPTNYCPPPHQMHTTQLFNGEMGSVFFLSPPYPYHHQHQVTN